MLNATVLRILDEGLYQRRNLTPVERAYLQEHAERSSFARFLAAADPPPASSGDSGEREATSPPSLLPRPAALPLTAARQALAESLRSLHEAERGPRPPALDIFE